MRRWFSAAASAVSASRSSQRGTRLSREARRVRWSRGSERSREDRPHRAPSSSRVRRVLGSCQGRARRPPSFRPVDHGSCFRKVCWRICFSPDTSGPLISAPNPMMSPVAWTSRSSTHISNQAPTVSSLTRLRSADHSTRPTTRKRSETSWTAVSRRRRASSCVCRWAIVRSMSGNGCQPMPC
jgi:hypothetical protein